MLSTFNGCLFEEVNQPSSAQPGEVININLVITDNMGPEPNAHKGILGIVVPSDWELVSASYTSPEGNGTLLVSSEWKDSVNKYYPAANYGTYMKWVVLISDQGYSYTQNIISFNVDLKLKVGQSEGCFNLGYLTTKATSGMLNNPSWSPVSFPHAIGVPDSNFCVSKYKVRRAEEWDLIVDRTSGWTGADGIYSIPLDGYEGPSVTAAGKQLILFSDTFIGEVDSNNRRKNASLVNNTLALLQSNNPDPADVEFFWKKDINNKPKAVFVPNTPEANAGDWYWLMDGIALYDTIYVYALRLNGSNTGGFGFEVNGVALLKFTLDDENFISDVQQFDTPLFSKDSIQNSDIVLGQAVMSKTTESGNPDPDGFIYVYGPRSSSNGKELMAARVLPENIESFSKYEYWNGTVWGNSINDCVPITNGISQEFSVTPVKNGKYLLVFQTGSSVALKSGDSPVGPFGIMNSIYNAPEILVDSDIFIYNAKAHPNLSTPDELLISYNVNSFEFSDHFNNADIYMPRFIYLNIKDTTTSSVDDSSPLPDQFRLNQNYPNPFNPSTKISFSVPRRADVSIRVYNALGQIHTVLLNRTLEAGNYDVDFDASVLASGVYFYRMEAGEYFQTRKMILIK